MDRKDRVPIGEIILGVVGTAGILAAAIAPGVFAAAKLFMPKRRSYNKRYITNAISRLKAKNYITTVVQGSKKYIRLTKEGEAHLLLIQNRQVCVPRPQTWDGKWRIVVFDIPEKQRAVRRKVRAGLVSFGFRRLQDSVWVYPYDCEELIVMLKANARIGAKVLYVVAEKVEYDKNLRQAFGL
ncbi:MAG: CRISPR-associated endonuclease Cas2 [Candidatus Yonathbacteria bacterium RIFOXYC1_FULL_52_10]|uniref:CRISPR-associated endonuclease Cas2 n=1 Tax=Candidatus Yonathbacteria bacterium RIFOXYD1_FULL_52_36 TaxID=1802730 RepID=A0A1G2SMS2_9BACT|nr:MAG: CRISPR-associated endonuclease Cas2 [Candidatus Yonathbacteria bacterium RIFOXYC1_FULL_52_10]OHA85998.1 MAG: CRISPR-associated endonuclease Cas2 [Candidatus Yonathbacteria bacterium RIFOXYD1_FULL_52_36]